MATAIQPPVRFKTEVIEFVRLDNTITGAPRFRMETADGTFETSPGSQVGFTIDPYQAGEAFIITLDGLGDVLQAVPAGKDEVKSVHTRVTKVTAEKSDLVFKPHVISTDDGEFRVGTESSQALSLFGLNGKRVDITYDESGVIDIVLNPNRATQELLEQIIEEGLDINEMTSLDEDDFVDYILDNAPDLEFYPLEVDVEWVRDNLASN